MQKIVLKKLEEKAPRKKRPKNRIQLQRKRTSKVLNRRGTKLSTKLLLKRMKHRDHRSELRKRNLPQREGYLKRKMINQRKSLLERLGRSTKHSQNQRKRHLFKKRERNCAPSHQEGSENKPFSCCF